MLATNVKGSARYGTYPNISRHELTTTMHHLSLCPRRESLISTVVRGCQDVARIFAELRIKRHAPPLVRALVTSFEFEPCRRDPQAECLTRYLTALRGGNPLTPSTHRLWHGLPGYLILFATHAFVPQRQFKSRKSPSPLVFLLISTHFTATLGIPLSSPALKKNSFSCSSSVKPRDFTTNLFSRLRTLYTQ